MVVRGQHHAPANLPTEKNPGTYSIGVLVGPRASLGILETRKIYFTCREWNSGPSNLQLSHYIDYVILPPVVYDTKVQDHNVFNLM
jgi:hypothetical protein